MLWVPPHKGIKGNEIADKLANEATSFPPEGIEIPYGDIAASVKKEIKFEHIRLLESKGIIKGIHYFQNFHNSSKRPWFHNFKVKRELITFINRCRSDHYNLNVSLFKIKVVENTQCDCAFPIQDLNHVLWNCPLFSEQRRKMYKEFEIKKIEFLKDVNIYLKVPCIKVLVICLNMFNECNLYI